MNRAEKRKFIRDLTANVRDEVLRAVPKMPDNWDGIELRYLLAARFEAAVMRRSSDRARVRSFNSDCLERNL